MNPWIMNELHVSPLMYWWFEHVCLATHNYTGMLNCYCNLCVQVWYYVGSYESCYCLYASVPLHVWVYMLTSQLTLWTSLHQIKMAWFNHLLKCFKTLFEIVFQNHLPKPFYNLISNYIPCYFLKKWFSNPCVFMGNFSQKYFP